MDNNRFLNYFLYAAITCVNSFTYLFLPLYLIRRGQSGGGTGLILMVFTLTALVTSFLIGIVEDRLGARGNTVIGLLFLSLFYAGLAAGGGFLFLVAVFFIGGLGSNMIRITMNALFLKTHDSLRQGREIGFFNFIYQLFMGFGIIAGSFLLERIDFRPLFAISAAFMGALIACALRLRPAPVSTASLSRYARDLLRTRVLLFSAALFLFYLHWGAEIACYTPFLTGTLHLGTAAAGVFMGMPILFLALSTWYFGWRRDRGESTIRLALIAIVCSGGGLILFGAAGRPIVSFFFRLVHEAGDAAFVIFTYVGIAQLFPRDRLGGTSGSMYVVMISAQSLGALVFSAIGGGYGYRLPYIIAGLCSLAAAALVLRARAHYRFEIPEA